MAIADAVLAGDKEKATRAARDHMTYVMEKSTELENEVERERISSLRFRQRET
jgi:DNA-binding GntR family transcriptional regulator